MLQNGFNINCMKQRAGYVSDTTIFRENFAFNKTNLFKNSEEVVKNKDFGPLVDEYKKIWKLVVDKG